MGSRMNHNCQKCGRWVGENGLIDVVYDDYNGGWELVEVLCERCLKLKLDAVQDDWTPEIGRARMEAAMREGFSPAAPVSAVGESEEEQ